MKIRSKVLIAAIGIIIIFVGLLLLPSPPRRAVPDTIEYLFGYRLKEEPTIIERKHEVPMGPQGISYWEDTTLRLSLADQQGLLAHLMADGRFKKRTLNGVDIYDLERPRWRVSWSLVETTKEFSYSYREF